MKAAYIQHTGPPENIIYGDLPESEPVETQVLIKVAAVSVNPVDTYVRSGIVGFELPNPFIVGCDVAGTVEAVGPRVTTLNVVIEYGVPTRVYSVVKVPLPSVSSSKNGGCIRPPIMLTIKRLRPVPWYPLPLTSDCFVTPS